jgi:hypothetical protein
MNEQSRHFKHFFFKESVVAFFNVCVESHKSGHQFQISTQISRSRYCRTRDLFRDASEGSEGLLSRDIASGNEVQPVRYKHVGEENVFKAQKNREQMNKWMI